MNCMKSCHSWVRNDLVGFLGSRPFFHADEPSAADLSVCGMLSVIRFGPMAKGLDLLETRPQLIRYMERVEKFIADGGQT